MSIIFINIYIQFTVWNASWVQAKRLYDHI